MQTCPHCQNKGVSGWGKFFLGPARTIYCKSCGNAVSVPWSSLLGILPLFGVCWVIMSRFEGLTAQIFLVLSALLWSVLFFKFVPLIKR